MLRNFFRIKTLRNQCLAVTLAGPMIATAQTVDFEAINKQLVERFASILCVLLDPPDLVRHRVILIVCRHSRVAVEHTSLLMVIVPAAANADGFSAPARHAKAW